MLEKLQLYGRNGWLIGLLFLMVFRVWFSAVLPMTGDEAYFVFWGEHPAGGYYDHPPMVGWWLSGLLVLSHAEWFLRLPALMLPLVPWCSWWIVRPHGQQRAELAAALVLLQPANVWNVLITTDTPVILFSMLSVVAYVKALRERPASGREFSLAHSDGRSIGLGVSGQVFCPACWGSPI